MGSNRQSGHSEEVSVNLKCIFRYCSHARLTLAVKLCADIDTIQNLIWDSQKASLQNEADEHQRKADELAEVMNNGISPYHWCICKNFDQYINGIHYKANYAIYLEKI